MKYLFSLLLLLFHFVGCDERPANVDQLELLELARNAESDISLVVPKSIDQKLVHCDLYVPQCLSGYKVKVKGIEVTALMYDKFEDAYKAARRVNGYWFKNWAFDDVKGEPVLERFVQKAFDAKLARKIKFPYPSN